MTAESPTTPETVAVTTPDKGAAVPRYALTLLLVIFVINNIDRQIINILAEPIRKELGLHDWQIGMMTGFAFALFYATLGIPIARLADKGNRPLIIAASVAVWSVFTAVCGATQTFVQLVLARVVVGVGEAGCTPAAVSLITDMFPRGKRASATGIYSMGTPIGALLGMAIGGLVADRGGWRMAFFVAAAPGLVVAVLAALTLKEPRKAPTAPRNEAAPPLMAAVRELRGCKTYVFFTLAGALQALLGFGNASFIGSFFFRNHGEALARAAVDVGLHTAGFLGLALGLIVGVSGVLGSYTGGRLADRHFTTDLRGLATQMTVINLIVAPLYISAMLTSSLPLALVLLFMQSLFVAGCYAPAYTVMQSVVQPRIRATAVAIYMLVVNLLGLGLGPMLVGALSDYLARGAGLGPAQGLRLALVASAALGFPVAALYWQARKHIARDYVE